MRGTGKNADNGHKNVGTRHALSLRVSSYGHLIGLFLLFENSLLISTNNLVLDLLLQFFHQFRIVFDQLLNRIAALAELVSAIGEP